MKVNVIETPDDHAAALSRISALIKYNDRSNSSELNAIAALVENYERRTVNIPQPDPVRVVEFMMRQHGLTPAELARLLKTGRNRVSEILNRRRKLTLSTIRELVRLFKVPADLLIEEYDLTSSSSAKSRVR